MVFTEAPSTASGTLRLRVRIARDAQIVANGREVTLTALDSLLSATQAAHGGVWFYQESFGQFRSRTRVDSVFDAVEETILSHKLPVWLAHRPDFSDLETTLGNSNP